MNDLIAQTANEAQHKASNPLVCAWVSASAGSGKTKVLTDRLLRLLLDKVEPEKILCLTFTKTAAATMANRLSDTLQKWSVSSDEELSAALKKLLGTDFKESFLITARQLFARVLDVRGGLKIMTIHSFCQKLLKRFPLEANLSPAFEVIEENSAKIYLKQSFNRIISSDTFKEEFNHLSQVFSEKKMMETLFDSQSEYRRLLSLLDKNQSMDSLFLKIENFLEINPTDTIESLIAPFENLDDWNEYKLHYLKKNDEIRQRGIKPEEIPQAKRVLETLNKIRCLQTATFTKSFITLFMATLNDYKNFKEQKDFLDYDDLIIKTEEMLGQANMSNWVLYKLDEGLDHILVDEAQDTNPHQWEIIRMIAQEFFSGESKAVKTRTIFAVGDRKQSIYSFQGADPDCFEKMRIFFKDKITQSQNRFEDIPFNISFRSTEPILRLVNCFILTQPAGLLVGREKPEDLMHTAFRQGVGGLVEIWPVEKNEEKEKPAEWDLPTISENTKKASLKLVQKIVLRIRQMLDKKEILESENRPIRAGDIMILLRRRGTLMNELVRALKEQHIPVAGADRLLLTRHIAIMDLISLAEFLLLPENDLKLAEVLKSPLFNLSEDELFDLAFGRKGSLFEEVKRKQPQVAEKLLKLLNLSDNLHPFELFSYVLNNGGRQAFLARLGVEANEMIDEFLNLCLTFERENTPSLQSFVSWIKEDDVEIKRDLEQAHQDAVRIMTIHGSKGLESKIVFLPDTCSVPQNVNKILWIGGLPFLLTKKEYHPLQIRQAICDEQNKALFEYNRLLYVAITRATDRLYIGGFTGQREIPGTCWYKLLEKALSSETKLESKQVIPATKEKEKAVKQIRLKQIPDWYFQNPPEETSVRPLSPSKMSEDESFEPSPLSEDQEQALKRGRFIHKLLQILPDIPENQRLSFIQKAKPADIDIPSNLLEIFEREEFKHLFGKETLAEVPIVGQINGSVVSGQIDRLVVLKDEVLIIDFKTNRYVPVDLQAVPLAYKEQMKAYKDLLKNIFSDKKRIRCFLFWTTNLKLMELQ